MKKFLLSIVALMMTATMMASDYTFTYATGTGSGSGDVWTYLETPFKIVQTKVGKTDINTTYAELRLYKEHTLAISTADADVTINSIDIVCANKTYGDALINCVVDKDGKWNRVNDNEAEYVLDAAGSACVITAAAQVRIKSITIKYDKAGELGTPEFSHKGGNIYQTEQLEITAPKGDIYFSTNGTDFAKYTSPLAIDKTMTVSAYAQDGTAKSETKSVSFVMARSYESIDALLEETPTAEGWPVIVPIQDEEIKDFYLASGQYKNGLYLVREANGKNFELFGGQGNTVPDEWAIGDKLTGTVKGIYQDYNGQWEISLIPGGWDEISNGGVIVTAPVISYDASTKTVTIESDEDVYYTTDGSTPTLESNLYEAPFTIEKTVTVKAIAIDIDGNKSKVVEQKCEVEGSYDYDNLAALKAACTATSQDAAPTVSVCLDVAVVTGVNGSNVFVKDNTGAFCLFGAKSGLKRGDVLSGGVTGKLYSYNNLPELSNVDWSKLEVSGEVLVFADETNPASVTKDDASKWVKFSGLKFISKETQSNKDNYTFNDANGNSVVLRDNFNNLSTIEFNPGDAYSYDMSVFVIPFKENIQYYATDAEDIVMNSTKEKAEITFDNIEDNKLYQLSQGTVIYSYTCKSDAPKVNFETTNAKVAEITELGVIALRGAGVATLTMSVDETATYTPAKDQLTVRVTSGKDGKSLANALSVGDVQALYVDGDSIKDVWVKAFIVGSTKSNMNQSSIIFGNGEGSQATNLVVADDVNETEGTRCIPVELPKGDVRTGLNLVDVPANYKQEVYLHGGIIKYMSVAGLKMTDKYTFDPTGINDIEIEKAVKTNGLYNIAGQKVDASYRGIVIMNGKKYILK